MPSRRPLAVTVLAGLWLTLGGCSASESPVQGCDNGKLSLDRDLPAEGVYWDCAVSTWPESTQRLPSIDTAYDPEPARQICMDKPISYNHTIPNSGAYRPVRAESGEYLYCPPQRWLNNLHHGATVVLYHPCTPLHQHRLLSDLARSCLTDYIVTPHPQLSEHMPIALVSWGRTLELSTVATEDICDWLETTQATRTTFDGVTQTRKYNLLLTKSARLHQQEPSTKIKESVRQCCEQTVSSLLSGATEAESSMKKEGLKQTTGGSKRRQMRAAIREKQEKNNNKRHNTTTNVSNVLTKHPNTTSTHGPPLLAQRTHLDLSVPRKTPQTQMHNQDQGLIPRPTTPLGSKVSETTLRTASLGLGRLTLQTAALQPSPTDTDLRKLDPSAGTDVLAEAVNSEQNHTVRPEALTLSSNDEGTDSIKQRDKDSDQHSMKVDDDAEEKIFVKDQSADKGKMKDNDLVDVKEREVERKQIHGSAHSRHKSENTGFEYVSKSQSDSQQNPQPTGHSQDCDGCRAGEHCDCAEASGAEARAAVNQGLPRTPRTDEAVWAAAALGFLLVLLTLSVLHTRLYRYWRTTPSLYWHDPRQDYDSVADVIRRRLQIAKRRRKRGRRQECVLLPSSSSSDEHP